MTQSHILRLAFLNLLLTLLSLSCPAQNKVNQVIGSCNGKSGYDIVEIGPGRIKLMAAFVKDKDAKKTLKKLSSIKTISVPMGKEGDDFMNSLTASAKEEYLLLANFHDQNAGIYDIFLLFSGDIDSANLSLEDMEKLPEDTLLEEILIIRPYARTVMQMKGDIPVGSNVWEAFLFQ